jgi:hypothetical protein
MGDGTELIALYDYEAEEDDELMLIEGERYIGLEILEGDEWWHGTTVDGTQQGIFPVTFVEEAPPSKAEDVDARPPATAPRHRKETAAREASSVPPPQAKKKKGGRAPRPKNTLKFAFWSHNMLIGAGFTAILNGAFTMIWAMSHSSNVRQMSMVHSFYLANTEEDANLLSSAGIFIGLYAIFFGLLAVPFEYKFGLVRPPDGIETKALSLVPLRGIFIIACSLPMWAAVPCMIAAAFTTIAGVVCCISTCKKEEYGGTQARLNSYPHRYIGGAKSESDAEKAGSQRTPGPLGWLNDKFVRLKEDDEVGKVLILVVYALANIALFAEALLRWFSPTYVPKQYIPNNWGPFAKAFGQLLNFNCSILAFPIVKGLITVINEFRIGHNLSLVRYIPLRKNILLHKLIAKVIFVCVWGHVIAHFVNYSLIPDAVIALFGPFPWVTGAIIMLAMFFIYSAALDDVRIASYQIFWCVCSSLRPSSTAVLAAVAQPLAMVALSNRATRYRGRADGRLRPFRVRIVLPSRRCSQCSPSPRVPLRRVPARYNHHWFIVFWGFICLHGWNFWNWAFIPLGIYLLERFNRVSKGRRYVYLRKVKFVNPVMELQFEPQGGSEAWEFKEGMYLFLNCPRIHAREYHPFTISSAYGDLVHDDYVSVHIKCHPGGWTEKLKDMLEEMNPKRDYPFVLSRRNKKGELVVGKNLDVDGRPLLLLDGPHAAPSQHFDEYKVCMVVGAGIGLTPCNSILRAVLKYKWRHNQYPNHLHLYWQARHADVKAFQWFIGSVTRLINRAEVDLDSGACTAEKTRAQVLFLQLVVYTRCARAAAARRSSIESTALLLVLHVHPRRSPSRAPLPRFSHASLFALNSFVCLILCLLIILLFALSLLFAPSFLTRSPQGCSSSSRR